MELSEATAKALELRRLFEALETKRYGKSWTTSDLALGLVGDVGDLVKLVQTRAGVRELPDVQERLEHELADCLWAVLVLADRLEVDIESAFTRTLRELEAYARRELEA